MSKKDDKHQQDHDELQKKLEEIQNEKNAKDGENTTGNAQWISQDDQVTQKIIQLEKELIEQQEIAKRAQHDYIRLKLDFDVLTRQQAEKEKTMEIDSLITIVKKFLPFVENLRKSLLIIPEEKANDPMTKWLQMMYDNFLKTLETMNIFSIESLGLVPDSFLHEPVSTQPVEDENLKWKIVQEFERGFVRKKDNEQRVIITSKVVVGQ